MADRMAVFAAQVLICAFLCLLHILGTSSVMMMTFTSSCEDTIWPAIVSKPNSPELPKKTTGFALRCGESKTVSAPHNWTGMLWGRTHCSHNATGKFSCATGNCGSYAVDCPSGTTAPVATTLADFTPNSAIGEYIYFVSLVNGFNLPLTVVPRGKSIISGGGALESYCAATGCAVDLNKECPKDVQILGHENEIIGCSSACEAFKESQDHYCGRSSTYSAHFKSFCPSAMAFEDDKKNTIFSCAAADYYDVNFCAINFSFASTPPPPSSRSYRGGTSPEGYSNNNVIPVGDHQEDSRDYDSTSTNGPTLFVIKIVAAVFGTITGGGFFTMLVHAIWSCCQRDHNCPLCNNVLIKLKCCSDCACCNCWNSSSPPSDFGRHQHGTSTKLERNNETEMTDV